MTYNYRYSMGIGDSHSVKVAKHLGAEDGPIWCSAYEYNYRGKPNYPVPMLKRESYWATRFNPPWWNVSPHTYIDHPARR